MGKQLWKGNEAIAEAAVCAGLEAYFGYPITPQTELLEYLAARLPALNTGGGNRIFLQAESELAAINMVYGAACAGKRVMTSSSSPGFSLMQEGLSYIAASQVPCVVVNVMRGGPGLGNLAPTQADYFQMTKGGGHGDYHPIVLAPSSVQEAVDLMYGAFDLAEKYRTTVILAIDGNIGQMMEPVEMPAMRENARHDKGFEVTGAAGRERRVITSLFLKPEELEAMNTALQEKDRAIRANEVRFAERFTEDAELVVVAFGSAARISQTAITQARECGFRVGLFRPISLYPFPTRALEKLSQHVHHFLVVEMSAGQMVEDVRLAVERDADVHLFGKMGGLVPLPDEIIEQIEMHLPALAETTTTEMEAAFNAGSFKAASYL